MKIAINRTNEKKCTIEVDGVIMEVPCPDMLIQKIDNNLTITIKGVAGDKVAEELKKVQTDLDVESDL